MKLKKFRAATVREALLQVKQEFGPQAVILKTETLKKGVMGSKDGYEVTAAIDEKYLVKAEMPTMQQPAVAAPPESERRSGTSKIGLYRRTGRKETAANASVTVMQGDYGNTAVATAPVYSEEAIHRLEDEIKALKDSLQKALQTSFETSIKESMQAQTPQIESIKKELHELKHTITSRHYTMLERIPEIFRGIVEKLLDAGLAISFINDLVADMTLQSSPEERSPERLKELAIQGLAKRITVSGSPELKAKRAALIMLVGPTGVGKSTTIAKITGDNVLKGNDSIGILSTDSYRMGAIEQMQAFANAADVDFETVFEKDEVDEALDRLSHKKMVLVDSAGRSLNHEEHMGELKQLVETICPDEVHLVLSSNMKEKDMFNVFNRFKGLGVSRIIFTKLDETAELGSLINLVVQNGVAISYLCNGQRIPDDIMIADSLQLARMVLEGI